MGRIALSAVVWLLVAGALAPFPGGSEDGPGYGSPCRAAGADEWPMFGGCPGRTSSSDSPGPRQGTPVWSSGQGGNTDGGPAVAGGMVYVGWNDRLVALEAANGTFKWSYTIPDGKISNHPLVYNGLVVFGAEWSDGSLYAVDARTGKEAWKTRIGQMYTTSPLGAGDMIYTGVNDGCVYALEPSNGSVIRTLGENGSIYMHSSIAYHNSIIYGGGDSKGIFAIRVTDGRVLWSKPEYSQSSSSVVHADGKLLFHTDDDLVALDARNGKELWRKTIGGGDWNAIVSAPAVGFGRAYIGTQCMDGLNGKSSTFFCIDQENGSVVWTITVDGNVLSTPLVSANGIVYFAANSFYAVSAYDGTVLWTAPGGTSHGQAALVEGTLYYADGQNLHAVRDQPADEPTIPGPPRNLQARPAAGQAILSWFPPEDDGGAPVSAYRIYRGSGQGQQTLLTTHSTGCEITVAFPEVGHTYYYCVTATNSAGEGNSSNEVGISGPENQDATGPEIEVTSNYDGQRVSGPNISLSGMAIDDSGLMRVEFSHNDGNWSPCEGTTYWSANISLRGGSNIIRIRAFDVFGNQNATSINLSYVTGSVFPTVTIDSPPDGANLTDAAVAVSGAAWGDSGIARVDISLNQSRWSTCDGTSDWSACITLLPGPNTIYVRAWDPRDRSGSAHIHVLYRISDATRPTIRVSYPSDGDQESSSRISVAGNADDLAGILKVELSTDGINWTLCTGTEYWSGSVTLKPGTNAVRVRATDASLGMNRAEVTLHVTLVEPDRVRPTIHITHPSEGERVGTFTVKVSGTASDNVGIYRIVVETGEGRRTATFRDNNWTCTVEIARGENVITASATDVRGNTATDSITIYYDENANRRPISWNPLLIGSIAMIAIILVVFILLFLRTAGPKGPPEIKK